MIVLDIWLEIVREFVAECDATRSVGLCNHWLVDVHLVIFDDWVAFTMEGLQTACVRVG